MNTADGLRIGKVRVCYDMQGILSAPSMCVYAMKDVNMLFSDFLYLAGPVILSWAKDTSHEAVIKNCDGIADISLADGPFNLFDQYDQIEDQVYCLIHKLEYIL